MMVNWTACINCMAMSNTSLVRANKKINKKIKIKNSNQTTTKKCYCMSSLTPLSTK